MKRVTFLTAWILALVFSVTSCIIDLDGGPYESDTRTFGQTGFDRLDMGSNFDITVRQGSSFDIRADGNRRDLDDLDVYVRGGTLYARYRNNLRSRRYETRFTITMPTLRAVDFSGASNAQVGRFTDISSLDVRLSGASKAEVDTDADVLFVDLSGASNLRMRGAGDELRVELSGASTLDSYDFPVRTARVDLSGASTARINVSQRLDAKASGGSSVRFRGTPTVNSDVSGGSSVRPD
ncbi:head GIN domain-containing protein [Tellurirhabdus rosea]|uniref:head GIN domain-containing protein n=1 Tax=Tellurirhabdus rosea TaxID=2674997 RepID=UPI002252295B|nr:head GIN domain-containing protein [Tellurirhabdus rosea]